jgi:hypothetical protein
VALHLRSAHILMAWCLIKSTDNFASTLTLSYKVQTIQNVPGGTVSTLGGHSIGHSKQKTVYVHVSYTERFSR